MIAELLIDQPIEKIIEDWDFLDERVLKRFSTFGEVGQNIYGIRANKLAGAQILDAKKGRVEAIIMGPSGVKARGRESMLIQVTPGGVPHRVRHSFGYWHINDMDELMLKIPPLGEQGIGHSIILMQRPTGSEGESFAWYCEKCLTMLHEYRYDTGRDGFDGFWAAEAAAVARYNDKVTNRTCPECGFSNPLGYRWNVANDTPAEAAARTIW